MVMNVTRADCHRKKEPDHVLFQKIWNELSNGSDRPTQGAGRAEQDTLLSHLWL